MLPTPPVGDSTMELIKSLQSRSYLQGFYLVGGTALALYLGHRKSVDIDLFSNFDFDAVSLLENIHQDFSYQLFQTAKNTLRGRMNDINVDLLAHRYSLLAEVNLIQGVKVLSMPDIAAMKLNAISISGHRVKDFIDFFYLLDQYNLGSMLQFYQKKYQQENVAFILKSLIYFNDVDHSGWPVLIKDPELKWIDVRKKIEKAVMDFTHSSIR